MNFDEALRLIHDFNARTREQAAHTLGLFYDTDAVAALLKTLQIESEERVKIAIVQALGKVYALEAVSTLEGMLWAGTLSGSLADIVKTELARIEEYRDKQPTDARKAPDATRKIPRDSMGEVPEADVLVQEAILAVEHHDHDQARSLLRAAVQIDPYHSEGWLWLSLFVDNVDEHRICLENVLHLHPQDEHAHKMLTMLNRHTANNQSGTGKADAKLYTVGGNVMPDGAIYVKRPADDELFQNCFDGKLSFVLTSRQRGKSSIVVQTILRLEAQNVATINVDLSSMGTTPQSIDEFYFGVLYIIVKRFGVTMRELSKWWREMERLSPVQRFNNYLVDELLMRVDVPIVVFVDEVDTVRSYNELFSVDDFFAVIRSLYNARATDERCRRLTFVLLGVAQPTDLIEDDKRTPFNIGSRIDLTDFNLLEAMELADGLGLPLDKSRKVMSWVMYWTNGHPNLSQKVCLELARHPSSSRTQLSVDALIKKLFLSPDSPDDNIQMVEGMFVKHPDSVQLIILYYRILAGMNINESEEKIELIEYLKLAGVIRTKAGRLVVRNRIYAAYFDEAWIEDRLRSVVPLEELQTRYADQLAAIIEEALPTFTRIKPIDRPLAVLKQKTAENEPDDVPRAKGRVSKKKLPETELFDPKESIPVTDELDDPPANERITERPTEPISNFELDTDDLDWLDEEFDTDDSAETIRFDDSIDPFDWLRQLPGNYLVGDSADDSPNFFQNVPPYDPPAIENKVSITGNAEETYDWMENISPDDLQILQQRQSEFVEFDNAPDDTLIEQESDPPDEQQDTPVQAQSSAEQSADEQVESVDDSLEADITQDETPVIGDPFGAYINTLDEDTIHHENDATADWLEDYVAEIDDREDTHSNGLFNTPIPNRSTEEAFDLPSPENAETIEELDDIWTEAINNAIEKMVLMPDNLIGLDDDPDLVDVDTDEDDSSWINSFDDDELFLYRQKFGEFKQGDMVFLPEPELEFRFDGRFFLLKTKEDTAESIAEAVFQPLYLELVDTPETYTLDEAEALLPHADSAWQRGRALLKDTLLVWRGLILLGVGLSSVAIAGISLIGGATVSAVSGGLLGFGVLGLISAMIFIRRDWLGADALEVRLEQISQTETFLPQMNSGASNVTTKTSFPQNIGDSSSSVDNARRFLPDFDSYLGDRWFSWRWKRQLQLAGLELSLTQFAVLHLLSAFSLYAFILVLSGGQQVTAILLGVVGFSLPQLYTAFAISNRVTRFKNQLPDTLGLWVNALRSGYSGVQAMESIARDAPEPTATEFKRTVQEVQVGIQVEDAYNHLLERVDDEDLDFVLTAVNIQREVGGNLAEILDVIGYTIRERIKLAGETATQVKARYRTFFVIAALLPLLQTVIFTPYFEQALTTITGQLALLMGYTLIGITLAFSANTNHVLRRTSVSADNFWVLRRDTLFDLGLGMALISLIFALGTSPLLVFWIGLMLFIIISDHAVLGLLLSIPVVATAVFTDGDLSTIPSQLGDSINISSQSALSIVGAGISVAILWRVWQSWRNNVQSLGQSLLDVRLVALCLQPINFALQYAFYLAPAKGLIEALVGKISPSSNEDASYRDEVTIRFYARCLLWALMLGVFAVWLGINANAAPLTIVAYAITGAVVGYFIPPLRRYNQIKRKQEQIRMALPDALDLLVICMEAGLGFDSAMGKVYEKWDNELALAFGRVLREIQLGKLRRVAMRDMAQRLNVTEVDSFVAAIIQSDQLGVSLARTMRIQSDQIRTAWKRRFENKVSTNNQIMDQLSLFLFVPGINLWLIAPIIARMFAG